MLKIINVCPVRSNRYEIGMQIFTESQRMTGNDPILIVLTEFGAIGAGEWSVALAKYCISAWSDDAIIDDVREILFYDHFANEFFIFDLKDLSILELHKESFCRISKHNHVLIYSNRS